jgi:5-formyltetrahydrofolate cyclo-ligase
MNLDIKLKKKNQRFLASKKRENLYKNIYIDNLFIKNAISNEKFFKSSKIVSSFISIKSEISTIFLNKQIEILGKTLCLPVIINNKSERLIFKKFTQGDNLIIGQYGVMEPFTAKICVPDLIFVPCLAFDNNGYRLGYGGGYYDKTIFYLNSINHNFLTIGFAYDDQKIEKVAHDDFDQKLNYILTEKQLYKF